ncbi:MAG TPA: hypothetical protein VF074_07230 [Pyrinomonadaceae bacterium]
MKKLRRQFLSNAASTSSLIPRHGRDLGNRFCSAKSTAKEEPCELAKHRGSTHPGHDFGSVRVMSESLGTAAEANDQTPDKSGDPDEKPMTGGTNVSAAEKDIDLGEERDKPVGIPVVDRVDLVTSSTGAVGGFPAIDCLADLNSPGPYNDQAFRGSVANVHQIHFHLSQGYPGDLRATRMVNRTSLRAGKNFPKAGNDGPPDHEFMYTKDKMVIADAPGWCKTLQYSDFPVNYKADFSIYAWDAPTKSILASMSYRVEIEKTNYSQPGPVNTVTVTGLKIGGAVKSPVKPKK